MGSTLIQTTLLGTDGNPLIDISDQQVEAIKSIIQQYAPGLGQVIKGIRPSGDDTYPIPCVQIQAAVIEPRMYALGKYQTKTTLNIIYYISDENPEYADQKASDVAVILRKLFSQNALNDISGAHTNNFKQYLNPPSGQSGWLNSEMSKIVKSPLMKFLANGSNWVCAGNFRLVLETTEII